MSNFSNPFSVKYDVSGKGVVAILTKEKRPVAFFSKASAD